ncbi:decapping 5-like protein [Drosera capensis]
MAAEGGGLKPTTSSPDSYIGSAISLASKSEIRYEGILFTINAVDSSIGLKTDLRVKSSLSVPATPSIENDPAIIQSHNPRPAAPTTSFPRSVNVSLQDMNSQAPQFSLPASNFQGGLPMYQPGVNLGSWGPTPGPPNTDAGGGGLAVPMYWQGCYGTPYGLPQLHPVIASTTSWSTHANFFAAAITFSFIECFSATWHG